MIENAPDSSGQVALVNMPWSRVQSPSLQCGLLAAVLRRAGIEVNVTYPSLRLAATLGPTRYDALSDLGGARSRLVGEWLFTRAAFGAQATATDAFLSAFPDLLDECTKSGLTSQDLHDLHAHTIPQYVEDLADDTDWSRYDVIGFTSTFQQNVPALALARAIKARHPGAVIVVGGANVDGVMGEELIRVIPWIDAVVQGEGESALVDLVACVMQGRWPAPIAGVVHRESAGPTIPAESMGDLDDLPVPDYDEYFATLDAWGRDDLLQGRRTWLPIESSRGCWWGERHQCRFCGLNGLGIHYRSKSPQRVVDEILELARRHQTLVVRAADNIIDQRTMGELCERLAATGYDLDIFYEVKANLTRAQLESLRSAGVTAIQPGIESLSSHVLELMSKGSSQLINVRTLKWGRHLRMSVAWSIITGFPGETAQDYADQVALIPLLHHLLPPSSVGPLWLERFSPYFAEPGDDFINIRPRPAYAFAYPIPDIDLARIAYFFDYDAQRVGTAQDVQSLVAAVEGWRAAWKRSSGTPVLTGFRGPGWMRVIDTRSEGVRKLTLTGTSLDVISAIDETFHSVPAILTALRAAGSGASREEVSQSLAELIDERLVIEDGGHFLSLVLPAPRR